MKICVKLFQNVLISFKNMERTSVILALQLRLFNYFGEHLCEVICNIAQQIQRYEADMKMDIPTD